LIVTTDVLYAGALGVVGGLFAGAVGFWLMSLVYVRLIHRATEKLDRDHRRNA
jgi:hypothetical protein